MCIFELNSDGRRQAEPRGLGRSLKCLPGEKMEGSVWKLTCHNSTASSALAGSAFRACGCWGRPFGVLPFCWHTVGVE